MNARELEIIDALTALGHSSRTGDADRNAPGFTTSDARGRPSQDIRQRRSDPVAWTPVAMLAPDQEPNPRNGDYNPQGQTLRQVLPIGRAGVGAFEGQGFNRKPDSAHWKFRRASEGVGRSRKVSLMSEWKDPDKRAKLILEIVLLACACSIIMHELFKWFG